MRNEQVEAVQGEMLHRDSDEPLVASELNEAATHGCCAQLLLLYALQALFIGHSKLKLRYAL